MYENGKQLNKHARVLLHKKKMKNHYAKQWIYGSGSIDWNTLVIEFRNKHLDSNRFQPNYWNEFYLSGRRQYAKSMTNCRIRANWRNESSRTLVNYNDELDSIGMRGGEYRKHYDYIGTV